MSLSRKIAFLTMTAILAGVTLAVHSHEEESGSQPQAVWDQPTENNTPRTMSAGPTTSGEVPEQARVALAISRKPSRPTTCTLPRDVGLQSHFMLLRLCRHEERLADAASLEESVPPPKNVASRNAS